MVFIFYLFISNFCFYYYFYHLIFLVFWGLCSSPRVFFSLVCSFLLPKSQLQGRFGLCPAAEIPRYLSCLYYTVARQSESQSQKSSGNHCTNTKTFLSPKSSRSNTEKNQKWWTNQEHSTKSSNNNTKFSFPSHISFIIINQNRIPIIQTESTKPISGSRIREPYQTQASDRERGIRSWIEVFLSFNDDRLRFLTKRSWSKTFWLFYLPLEVFEALTLDLVQTVLFLKNLRSDLCLAWKRMSGSMFSLRKDGVWKFWRGGAACLGRSPPHRRWESRTEKKSRLQTLSL